MGVRGAVLFLGGAFVFLCRKVCGMGGKLTYMREATRDGRMEELIRQRRLLNMHLCECVRFFGAHGLPIVEAYEGAVPRRFIGFNRALTSQDYDAGVHFFIDDYQFERVWNTPEKYVPLLRRFRCVIAPDFSLYIDLPPAVNFWNIYRNRLLAAWWQSQGIRVIPSASWGNADSFRFCFEGLPHSSLIAVGHTAIGRNRCVRNYYNLGLKELERQTSAKQILIYGTLAGLGLSDEIEYICIQDNISKLRDNARL